MTLEKKAAIIKLIEQGRTQVDVAKEFNVSKQTLSDYVKNKEKILSAVDQSHCKGKKNDRKGQHPILEEALQLWLRGVVTKNLPVSGNLLKQKAEMFAFKMDIHDFKFTDGWLRGFKKRHGVSFKKVCGESGAVDLSTVTDYRTSKLNAIMQEFAPANIFNCDETGLFFKMLPDRSLSFSSEACTGGKHSKERVTVMVGANADGTEKLPLLVIGKAKNPRCFKGVKNLPVWYSSNTKAWITQSLFEDYLRRLDRMFERQKRQVVIFVDNCGAHGAVNNLQAVRLEFLPPNTTSVLQPMDQGVIKNLKVHYRARLLGRTLVCFDSGKSYSVNLFSALGMLADAWKAVQPSTIANCFRHAGFCNCEEASPGDAIGTAENIDNGEQLIADLRSSGMDLPAAVTFDEFAAIDDNIELCAELTDDEIVRQVTAPPQSDLDSDDEDDACGRPQPSPQDVANALALLYNIYDENMTLAQMQADVIANRRNLKQGSIRDFFSPV